MAKLIHDGTKIIALIEGRGNAEVLTAQVVFDGTEAECQAEITRLGLIPLSTKEGRVAQYQAKLDEQIAEMRGTREQLLEQKQQTAKAAMEARIAERSEGNRTHTSGSVIW